MGYCLYSELCNADTYSQHSQYLGFQYCSYSQYSEREILREYIVGVFSSVGMLGDAERSTRSTSEHQHTSRALKMGGRSLSNWTSTTAPITWVTRPTPPACTAAEAWKLARPENTSARSEEIPYQGRKTEHTWPEHRDRKTGQVNERGAENSREHHMQDDQSRGSWFVVT